MELDSFLNSIREQQLNLVLATGVFDVLHQEHINFLRKAKRVGDALLVGIESDVRVRSLKGEGRPVNPQQVRIQNLLALQIPDHVFVLPEEFDKPIHHESLIAHIKPHILAVSSSSPHLDKKEAIVSKYGGELAVVHEHNPSVSTTQILTAHNGILEL